MASSPVVVGRRSVSRWRASLAAAAAAIAARLAIPQPGFSAWSAWQRVAALAGDAAQLPPALQLPPAPRLPFRQPGHRGRAVRLRAYRTLPGELPAWAYRELGLPVGAELADVKRAFRRLARENHPDLCAPEDLAAAGERFVAVKQAYDEIMACLGQVPLGGNLPLEDVGRNMDGFKRNMVTRQGHHKLSDGRMYELWLDFRGHPEFVTNARQEVMSLFWQVRLIVDELGVSLAKEGVISGVLTDLPEDESPDASGGPRSLVESWDYEGMPLMLVDVATGLVLDGTTRETLGRLRSAVEGQLLGGGPGGGGAAAAEDLVVAASDAWEAQRGQRRYGVVMRAMALPPDPAAWSVAAALGASPGDVLETQRRIDEAAR